MPNAVPTEQQSFPPTAFAASTDAESGPSLGYADLAATARRRRSIHGKRSIITPVACQPCQRRKHKCDGMRPVCTPCLGRRQIDCVYDAAGDQRRTSSLKARIQDLVQQVDDLKDIVAGISVAEDSDAAIATARQLAADNFQYTAAVADALRTEHGGTAEDLRTKSGQQFEQRDRPRRTSEAMTPRTTDLHTSSSSKASTDSAGLDESGAMFFSPWLFDRQADVLGFTYTGFPETAPTGLADSLWQSDDQASPSSSTMANAGLEVREDETEQFQNDPGTGVMLGALSTALPGQYWCPNNPGR